MLLSEEKLKEVNYENLYFLLKRSSIIQKYNENGYVVLDNYMSHEECQNLKDEIAKIIESKAFLDELKQLPSDKRQVNVNFIYEFIENTS